MVPIEIKLALPRELRQVLRCCLAGPDRNAVELERRVGAFLEYAQAMSFDLSRQWWCRRENRAVSACLCIESPGRTAMLLLPEGVDEEAQRRLIEYVAEQESVRDIRLLQALIDVRDAPNRCALQRADFLEIAVLNYLELNTTNPPNLTVSSRPGTLGQNALTVVHYETDLHSEFAEIIKATYEDSLDCPRLSELRDIEDVVESHKGAGRFKPHRWLLLRYEGRPAACILLTENPIRPVLELVYMGVHPHFRRRSLGRYVLGCGINLACRERFQAVTLAVDSKNRPACRLYERVGFRQTHRRRALIRRL
ncbi:MAG: GNAT family N-acetyltransferase [Phycisphaerales bacterium]|nr:GNAT family N-acetyltransferase [Phycisphaerales bacterium]